MADVLKFEPVVVGDGFRFDADEILEAAKGAGFKTIVVIGELEDGSSWISGSANAGESIILMERAKHNLIFGEDD